MKRMNQGKIAFIFIILIAIACLLFSCSDLSREKIVDKSELTGRDYRLFQNTPAWELAKAVEDENTNKRRKNRPEFSKYSPHTPIRPENKSTHASLFPNIQDKSRSTASVSSSKDDKNEGE